jgi:hypothetical protein
MNDYYLTWLLKNYSNKQPVSNASIPINQNCCFIFYRNNKPVGSALAKLEFNETATDLIARDNHFCLLLPKNVQFDYWYGKNLDNGIFVCYVELGG